MKKPLLVAAKVVISVSLITWILRQTDLTAIWSSIREANFALVLAAFALFYLGYFVIAQRQQGLLEAQNIRVSIGFLVQSFAVGMFFTNLLPSTIGGDASRMIDVYRVGGSKSRAVSVILIDRFFGMFALVIIGCIAVVGAPALRESIPGIALYLGGALVMMLAVLWIVFGSGSRLLDWIMGLPLGPLGFAQRILGKIIGGFELFKGRGDVLVKATLWSFVLQINVILHYLLIAYAVGIDVPVGAMFVIVPIAIILMLIPISINGIGLRETIFVFLLGTYGATVEQSVAFAWISLALILAQGVIGGIVFLLRRGVTRQSEPLNSPPE